ncbi:MAG: bifunctional sulfate adenylyltransferase/adenylylsulfate kinase [Gammaproteobacteria bacterium]|nr:bifunctional sulfate adenylyltransferase/adenylylsulfate kinase [Gammaproteobacteria bacterium]
MKFSIPPYGGQLCDLLVGSDRSEQLKQISEGFPSVTLSQRQVCDLELLMNGAFSPLTGFMGQDAYNRCVEDMRLPSGELWPMPVTLDIPAAVAAGFEVGQQIALRDGEGFMPAVLTIEDIWQPDKRLEAEKVYGTTSELHPGVRYLYDEVHDTYIGGRIEGIQGHGHFDFENLWDTPEELRNLFQKMGWRRVVGFQTSRPMHRMHRELTLRVAKDIQGHILLHPAVGVTKPGDLHYYARVHCYQAIRRRFPHNLAILSLLPLAMRMAGPREALWHTLIHQNFGCSHFIVGPHHASPPQSESVDSFYAAQSAQDLVAAHQQDMAIQPVLVEEMKYQLQRKVFLPLSEFKGSEEAALEFTDNELKECLTQNREVPDWFSYPEVIHELRKVCPPRSQQGLTLFFTGLSGAGKSTIAKIVYAKMIESGGRPVTLLDGDVVRLNLSSELGFSKEHRNLNVRRIGFVASQITKNRGVAICAPIAPYAAMRAAARGDCEAHGAFIEVHVATPLDVCESRDRKGLYAKARKGLIPEFTGVSDPYEIPEAPEIRIDTSDLSPMEAAEEVFLYLFQEGYLDLSDD